MYVRTVAVVCIGITLSYSDEVKKFFATDRADK